jgi:hypothetical protein
LPAYQAHIESKRLKRARTGLVAREETAPNEAAPNEAVNRLEDRDPRARSAGREQQDFHHRPPKAVALTDKLLALIPDSRANDPFIEASIREEAEAARGELEQLIQDQALEMRIDAAPERFKRRRKV